MSKKDLFYGDVEGRMEELKQKPITKEKETRGEKINKSFSIMLGLVIIIGLIFSLMMLVFMVLAVILSVALIVLVTIQPRQTQIFSTDATSNIGKPSYWASQPIRKMLTLAISIALFILLLIFMIVSYK